MPDVTVTHESITYRASAFGHCFRRLWAARSGYDPQSPPKALQERFDKGTELEDMILDKLSSEYGWTLTNRKPQMEVSLNVGTNHDGIPLFVVGHPDALGTGPNMLHSMPVDAKAFAQSTMDNFLGNGIRSFPYYSWQQSVYCIGLGDRGFCLPLFNKDTCELTVKVFTEPPHNYEDIQERVFQVEEYIEQGTQMPDIPCGGEWGCPFSYLHDPKLVDALPEVVEPLVSNYLLAKRKVDTYTLAKKVLAEQITPLLPYTDDQRSFTGREASVTVSNNAKRMDTQKVKELLVEAGEDLDEYYIQGEGVHLVVKEKPHGD